ncbi:MULTISPECIES: ABC transporter ATP-binding protein [unclassified Paenibacillus]|uniref:ABC transporter ATP-binding protein n=1 Tax=unclassified Paenibacillus TaxID=185978 RepID=UPI001AE13367|nr:MULTISPECIES: ABC transporter ATP-binding protein [unclassified Paenibacillus]MBP1157471.1 ABC-2 type transport system ATP-binding protein/lipopolysaccharide transport system ATP-binding protein [Paenibacillus sp. PvP091]MBP1171792.1 ABC-2 type transport system ATP-binding protein/lipopolysaccharide transport system ATP-binding protein [Paenibacillus sp. PvR098]MBP2438173.1 ABC-2 type transport system ATP-binding protein/lipopolysaccharide transport system ATP-binding protein [Paenibacillus s
MDQIVISIKNVSKAFKIYRDKPLTLKEKLLKLRSNEYSPFFAVKNVSLDIKKGETIGLIGHNGCGKSTMLKLITKILYPDSGEINVNGRISSLIELGAGFHPDFTGRENIYINASIFGLSKKEVDEKIDEIIRFSELGEFIENPVRTYSSGMYMRLAFSVAINVNPEILLIDEILSVGDANFQKKCYDKIEGFKLNGATIVIVAHDLGTIEKICDRVIWMDKGEIIEQGEADRVVNLYTQHMNKRFVEQKQQEYSNEHPNVDKLKNDVQVEELEVQSSLDFPDDIRWGSKEVEITEARIVNSKGETTNVLSAGESVVIEINYKVNSPQKEYIFGMGFYTSDKVLVYGNNTQIGKLKLKNLSHVGTVKFKINDCNLLSGNYKLNVAVVDGDHRALDFIKFYMDFTVISNDKAVGVFSLKHNWEIV